MAKERTRSQINKNNKRKGNVYETIIARKFREAGYSFAKTSRQASRLLDNCKVDIAFVPYNVQCKNGYDKPRLKPEEVLKEMDSLLEQNIPPGDQQHKYPKLIFHKFGKQEFVYMDINTAMELIAIKKLYDDNTGSKDI